MIYPILHLLSSLAATTITGIHTEGGRHISWQLDYPDGFDTTVAHPAFLEFHGDLGAGEQSVLELTSPNARRWAYPHKAYAITFAGQDATTDFYRRLNGSLDAPLMVSAIRSNLGGIIKIDTTRIVLHGMSSGGGFVDNVLQKQLTGWGGGTFIQCGIHNYMADPIPDPAKAGKFKVFVATTKDDFLYSSYHPIYEHARYWSGYDVRYTTAGGGGHCSTAEGTKDSAVAWLFGNMALDSGAYRQTFVPHWRGISNLSGIKAVAATPSGVLWVATSQGGKSSVLRSRDQGATWTSVWSLPDSASYVVGGMAAFGETVVVSHLRKLVVIPADQTKQYTRTITDLSPAMTSDGKRIWMKGKSWSWSTDTGKTWNAVPSDWSIADQMATGALRGTSVAPPHFTRKRDSTVMILLPSADFTKADSVFPASGRILSSTRKGDTLLATVWDGTKQSLQVWIAGSWRTLPWPGADGVSADTKVTAIHQLGFTADSRPMVMGRPSYVGTLDGKWERMPSALSATPEPTALSADGRILRVAYNGFGLMLWIPTEESPSGPGGPPPRTSSIGPSPEAFDGVRRIGSWLELSAQGAPWQVRWLDGRGRTLHVASHEAHAMIPLAPSGRSGSALFVEIENARGRMVVPAVR